MVRSQDQLGERVLEPQLRTVSRPGDMPVGPDRHGRGSSQGAGYRKFPGAAGTRGGEPGHVRSVGASSREAGRCEHA